MTSTSWLSPRRTLCRRSAALGAGPVRTRRFLDGYGPAAAWAALAAAATSRADPDRAYQSKPRPSLVEAVADACNGAGMAVRMLGRPGYPVALAPDPESAPASSSRSVIRLLVDRRPRVTIVGTRKRRPLRPRRGRRAGPGLGRGRRGRGVGPGPGHRHRRGGRGSGRQGGLHRGRRRDGPRTRPSTGLTSSSRPVWPATAPSCPSGLRAQPVLRLGVTWCDTG